VREQVETTLRELLVPLFAADGGTVELVGVNDGVVQLRFGGAYRGCPSVAFTVQGFVLPALRKAVGREVRVEVLP
jgi:NFU1 iron-sulfur cluster scaffold homolog, mitochondrial